jgi:hypothetical protein
VTGVVFRIMAVNEGFWTAECELDTEVTVGIGRAAAVEGYVELGSTMVIKS